MRILLVLAAILGATPSHAEISSKEISGAIKGSDDYAKYAQVFLKASMALVRSGTCTLKDLRNMGGWVKSTTTYRNHPVYFTYCGGMTISNRLYLDVSNGRVFK